MGHWAERLFVWNAVRVVEVLKLQNGFARGVRWKRFHARLGECSHRALVRWFVLGFDGAVWAAVCAAVVLLVCAVAT